MGKLRNWIDNTANKIRARDNLNDLNKAQEEYAPNKYTKPFEHQQWKIIGDIFEYNEARQLRPEAKPFKEFVYRFSRNYGALFGFVVLVLILVSALIIPLTTYSTSPEHPFHLPPGSSSQQGFIFHILGTNNHGSDYWALLWHGLRYSLALAFVVTFITVVVGVVVGVLMGQFEKIDAFFTFIIKIISVVPSIILLILLTIIVKPSFWVIVFALSITSWTGIANQIRAQVKRARNFEWVAASKVLGTPTYKILKNYVPVILPILITQLVFSIPGVILSETSLAFIGLAIDDVPTLGKLISDGQKEFPSYLRYVFIPASFLILITASIQLIGAGIQDSLRRQR
ncbi:ABC transporter permease [Mycoplasma corogypsi]|uniref:ABC transporter permease n=1 Tax=Mycoplasma corogypsi TaxID=2106 RepID=UPI003873B2FB